jgi:hypothetical protein
MLHAPLTAVQSGINTARARAYKRSRLLQPTPASSPILLSLHCANHQKPVPVFPSNPSIITAHNKNPLPLVTPSNILPSGRRTSVARRSLYKSLQGLSSCSSSTLRYNNSSIPRHTSFYRLTLATQFGPSRSSSSIVRVPFIHLGYAYARIIILTFAMSSPRL